MFKEDIMQQVEPENISVCCCSHIQCVVKILKWMLMSQTWKLCSKYCVSLKMMAVSVQNICSPNIPAIKETSIL